MSVQTSAKLANLIASGQDVRSAIGNFKRLIYSGTKPTTADAAIITEYRGMKVSQLGGLRRQLRTAGGEYKVYKNTLARLGARQAGVDGLEDILVGPTGITFVSGDAAAVAKIDELHFALTGRCDACRRNAQD